MWACRALSSLVVRQTAGQEGFSRGVGSLVTDLSPLGPLYSSPVDISGFWTVLIVPWREFKVQSFSGQMVGTGLLKKLLRVLFFWSLVSPKSVFSLHVVIECDRVCSEYRTPRPSSKSPAPLVRLCCVARRPVECRTALRFLHSGWPRQEEPAERASEGLRGKFM